MNKSEKNSKISREHISVKESGYASVSKKDFYGNKKVLAILNQAKLIKD